MERLFGCLYNLDTHRAATYRISFSNSKIRNNSGNSDFYPNLSNFQLSIDSFFVKDPPPPRSEKMPIFVIISQFYVEINDNSKFCEILSNPITNLEMTGIFFFTKIYSEFTWSLIPAYLRHSKKRQNSYEISKNKVTCIGLS